MSALLDEEVAAPQQVHPARFPLLVIGSLLALAAVVSTAMNIMSIVGRRDASGGAPLLESVGAVRVDTGWCGGKIVITGEDRSDSAVTWRTGFSTAKPEPAVSVQDGVLVIDVNCWNVNGWSPFVDFDIRVPREVDIDVDAKVRVEVTGTEGRLDVDTNDGSLHARDVEVTEANLHSGDGDLHLVAVGRAPAVVLAESGDGDVEVELPDVPEAYAVVTDVGDGSIDVRVRTDLAATSKITAQAGNGDVTVRYSGG